MKLRYLTVIGALAASAASAPAAQVMLREGLAEGTYYPGGYAGTADTTLLIINPTGPDDAAAGTNSQNSNTGGWAGLYSAFNGTIGDGGARPEREILMRFDLSAMGGQNLVVNSATLQLTSFYSYTTTQTPIDETVVNVYEILPANAGWGEGNQTFNANNQAAPGDATFANRNFDPVSPTPWAGSAGLHTPGVDFNAVPLDTIDYVYANPINTKYDATLSPALVQSWIDNPSANAGLLLQGGWAGSNSYPVGFASSEQATASQRPMLILDVTVVPEPATVALLAAAPLALLRRRRIA